MEGGINRAEVLCYKIAAVVCISGNPSHTAACRIHTDGLRTMILVQEERRKIEKKARKGGTPITAGNKAIQG